MSERFLIRRKLKPECVNDYLRWHQQVPEALVAEYKKAGVKEVSCFLLENELVVYLEVEQPMYENAGMGQNPVDMEWQALMAGFNDPDFQQMRYEEVYRMKGLQ
jgi:L-rhamnose mutarotase